LCASHHTIALLDLSRQVLVAAQVKVRADALWPKMKKDKSGHIERLACWAVVMADEELGYILGKGDAFLGNA